MVKAVCNFVYKQIMKQDASQFFLRKLDWWGDCDVNQVMIAILSSDNRIAHI